MLKFILSFIAVFFMLAPCILAQQQMQDVIYLKDGTIVRGTIIEQVPNVSVKLQTKDGNIFVYKMEDIMKTTKEAAKGGGGGVAMQGEKSPGLACVLSLILPGLGQYYNGEYVKGIIQDGLYAGGWVMVFALGHKDKEYYYYDYYYDYWGETEITPWFWIGLGTVLGTELWSMIDAPISASNINRKMREQGYGHLFELKKDKYTLGLDAGPMKQGIGAKLTLHF